MTFLGKQSFSNSQGLTDEHKQVELSLPPCDLAFHGGQPEFSRKLPWPGCRTPLKDYMLEAWSLHWCSGEALRSLRACDQRRLKSPASSSLLIRS